MSTWGPLAISLHVAGVATIVAGVLGLAIATLLASERCPGRQLLDVLVTAPMVLPPTVLGYYVLVAVGRRSAIGGAFEDLFGSSLVFTRTGAVLAATLGALPLVVKSARTALEGVDPTLVRAAATLGAGRLRTYLTVCLPIAAPGIIAGLMLGFARSLGDFGVTLMVAGDIPGRTQTASLAIFDALQANQAARAQGMIIVLSATAMGVLYAVNKLTGTNHAR
jgi:molybdate transport system permease protein